MCSFLAQTVGEIADKCKSSSVISTYTGTLPFNAGVRNGRSRSDVSIYTFGDMGTGFLIGLNGEFPSLNSSGDIC